MLTLGCSSHSLCPTKLANHSLCSCLCFLLYDTTPWLHLPKNLPMVYILFYILQSPTWFSSPTNSLRSNHSCVYVLNCSCPCPNTFLHESIGAVGFFCLAHRIWKFGCFSFYSRHCAMNTNKMRMTVPLKNDYQRLSKWENLDFIVLELCQNSRITSKVSTLSFHSCPSYSEISSIFS